MRIIALLSSLLLFYEAVIVAFISNQLPTRDTLEYNSKR
jgi:hypothetical protein